MSENQVVGVLVIRKGRAWRVILEKSLMAGFVERALVSDGLKLADARAEAERTAAGYGVQVREIK